MTFDVCMIVLTAFAVFGGYCLAEMIFDALEEACSPPSVTFMIYGDDDHTYKKVRQMYNNIPNNTIVFLESDGKENIYPDSVCCAVCEISDIVTNVLFTKNN